MGAVGFFQLRDVFRLQFYLEGSQRILQVGQLAGADDGRGHALLGQKPRQRGLGRFDAQFPRHRGILLNDLRIGLGGVQALGEIVGLSPCGVLLIVEVFPGQVTARQRAPGNDGDTFLSAQGQHLPLLFGTAGCSSSAWR